jgi:hypothetical protein
VYQDQLGLLEATQRPSIAVEFTPSDVEIGEELGLIGAAVRGNYLGGRARKGLPKQR